MYGGNSPVRSVAAAAGTEGGAIGFTLGACSFVLNLNLRSGALAVNGVVLAVCYVTVYAGDFVPAHFLIAHDIPPKFIAFRQVYYLFLSGIYTVNLWLYMQ